MNIINVLGRNSVSLSLDRELDILPGCSATVVRMAWLDAGLSASFFVLSLAFGLSRIFFFIMAEKVIIA